MNLIIHRNVKTYTLKYGPFCVEISVCAGGSITCMHFANLYDLKSAVTSMLISTDALSKLA